MNGGDRKTGQPTCRSPNRTRQWPLAIAFVALGSLTAFWGNDWGTAAQTGFQLKGGQPISFLETRFQPGLSDAFSVASQLNSPIPRFRRRKTSYLVTRWGAPWLFLVRTLSPVQHIEANREGSVERDRAVLWLRRLTALASALAIALACGVAGRLLPTRVTQLGIFLCLAPLAVQLPHLAVPAAFSPFSLCLALQALVDPSTRKAWRRLVTAGAALGLGLSFDLSMTPALSLLFLWPIESAASIWRQRLVGLVTALAVFALLTPASVMEPAAFWGVRSVFAGEGEARAQPFSGPFRDDFEAHGEPTVGPASLASLGQALGASFGWAAVVVAGLGLLGLKRSLPRHYRVFRWLLLAQLLWFWLWPASAASVFAPMLPVFALLVAAGFEALPLWLGKNRLATAVSGILMAHIVLSGLATAAYYGRPDPRAAALRWAATKYPPGAVVVSEDMGLLIPRPLLPASRQLPIASMDWEHRERFSPSLKDMRAVVNASREGLVSGDAVQASMEDPDWSADRVLLSDLLIASGDLDAREFKAFLRSWAQVEGDRERDFKERLLHGAGNGRGTIQAYLGQGQLLVFSENRPRRYRGSELAGAYYDELFRQTTVFPTPEGESLLGNLYGYRLARELSSEPSLLGLVINPTSEPPDLRLYDHPTVYVFERVGRPLLHPFPE